MCKKNSCLILVFLNLFFSTIVHSAIEPFCDENLNQKEISSIYSLKPSKINIKILDYRLWSINNLQILSDDREYPYRDIILEKNKKRFKSTIEVIFPNNIKCKFNSTIRQSGDWKDHIYISRGKIFQSVDIKLIDGVGITMRYPRIKDMMEMNEEDGAVKISMDIIQKTVKNIYDKEEVYEEFSKKE